MKIEMNACARLSVLKQKYGEDRVRVASMGEIVKPDGSVRPIHDGTHSVHVNRSWFFGLC